LLSPKVAKARLLSPWTVAVLLLPSPAVAVLLSPLTVALLPVPPFVLAVLAGAGGGGGAPVAVGGICRTTGAAGNRPRMLADGRGCFRGGTVLPHHPVNGDAHVLSRWTLCRIRIGRLGRGRPRRRG